MAGPFIFTHEKISKVLFINHIARLLKIKRPEPFEIEIPKTDTFSNDGSADDERTNDLLYGHELGGIDKGALVSLLLIITYSGGRG